MRVAVVSRTGGQTHQTRHRELHITITSREDLLFQYFAFLNTCYLMLSRFLQTEVEISPKYSPLANTIIIIMWSSQTGPHQLLHWAHPNQSIKIFISMFDTLNDQNPQAHSTSNRERSHIDEPTIHIHLSEASAMRFISQHTSIPVPNALYVFTHSGRTYIVIERIKGA